MYKRKRHAELRAVREAGGGHQIASAIRCKGKSRERLQGVQLELFPVDPPPIARESTASSNSRFPLLAGLEVPLADADRPLSDLFPEAYV